MTDGVVKKTAAHFCRLRLLAGAFLFALALKTGAAEALRLEAADKQPFFTIESAAGTDFSGLTWAGGENFLAVSDKVRAIFRLRLRIEAASGKILEGAFEEKIPLLMPALSDFEGIALNPKTRRVVISAEGGSGFFSVGIDGNGTRPLGVPAVFKKARPNMSVESMTFGAGVYWSANEEALECDGPIADAARGGVVRLQKFDSTMKPAAQFAYRTEPCGRRYNGAGTGVADLLALPEGELLVLERVFGVFGLSVKIFQVRLAGATDTTRIAALEGAEFVPVEKKLLFEMPTFSGNFEGITLGPTLAGGWRSVVLVADSAGANSHLFLALKLSPAPAK